MGCLWREHGGSDHTELPRSDSKTAWGPQSRPAEGATSNAREKCCHEWRLGDTQSGDIHRSCRTDLQRVPRRCLPFLNSSNVLFHMFNSDNIPMQLSCNYILTRVLSIRYTQVRLKRKTTAKNVTIQTHNLQRAAPCKRFQQAVQVNPLSPKPCRTTRTNMSDTSWRKYQPLQMT